MEWKPPPANRVRNVRRFDTSMVSTCGMERCCKKKNQGGYGGVRDGDGADGAEGAATSESKRTGFGEKKITFWGSFALILNNAMGPGMLVLPLIMQEAGLITSMIVLVAVYLLSTVSCTMLCDAIQRIPGNRDFTQRVANVAAVKRVFPTRAGRSVSSAVACTSAQTRAHARTHTHTRARARAHTHTHTLTCTRTHTHARARTHTHKAAKR